MRLLSLLKQRQFAAYFWTQFFGAFNDNFFKNALVILITFKAADSLHLPASVLVTLAAGIFILPFFLFSATAGQIAEAAEKSKLIRKIKIFEILIMLLATYGFLAEKIIFLLIVLFLMGFQSALFGPVKYSIIPQIVKSKDLLAANALVEMGTFLAILLGTLLGGLAIVNDDYGIYLAAGGVLVFSFIGWLCSLLLTKMPALIKDLKINWNPFTESIKIISFTKQNDKVFYSVIGISWFWLLGASFLSLFPSYAKDYLAGNEYVVNVLLTSFSLGIGIGSILCESLAKGKVSFRLVPFGMLGMSVSAIALYLLSPEKSMMTSLGGVELFFNSAQYALILISLVAFSLFGGIYIVPLYSMAQKHAKPESLSRVIAGNNIFNSLFMVVSSLVIIVLLKLSLGIPQIFALLAIGNLFIAYILFGKLAKT